MTAEIQKIIEATAEEVLEEERYEFMDQVKKLDFYTEGWISMDAFVEFTDKCRKDRDVKVEHLLRHLSKQIAASQLDTNVSQIAGIMIDDAVKKLQANKNVFKKDGDQ